MSFGASSQFLKQFLIFFQPVVHDLGEVWETDLEQEEPLTCQVTRKKVINNLLCDLHYFRVWGTQRTQCGGSFSRDEIAKQRTLLGIGEVRSQEVSSFKHNFGGSRACLCSFAETIYHFSAW